MIKLVFHIHKGNTTFTSNGFDTNSLKEYSHFLKVSHKNSLYDKALTTKAKPQSHGMYKKWHTKEGILDPDPKSVLMNSASFLGFS